MEQEKNTFFRTKWGRVVWSFKYERCTNCKSQNYKHKWHWLCVRCWAEERNKNWKKSERKEFSIIKWNLKRKFLKILDWKKKRWRKDIFRDKAEYKKVWIFKQKALSLKLKWKIPLKMYFCWELVELPFETLEKPRLIGNYRGKKQIEAWKEFYKKYEEEMKQYKKNLQIFYFIRNFYLKWKVKNYGTEK